MDWRVANSLLTLRKQIDALAPNRDKSSDGTIGDQSHASRNSDHNPNADGVVTAMDITNDPAHGVSSRGIAEMLLISRDPRIKYVISNSQIYSSPAFSSAKVPWTWRAYDGPNAHTQHVHISVLGAPALYDDTRAWSIDMASTVQPRPEAPPVKIEAAAGALGVFEKCMAVIEKWEGGFDNDPDDPGGPTNMGITQSDLARWRQKPVTVDDVRNLTRDEACQIYREFYWKPINGDKLPLAAAQLCLDAAVLTGVSRAGIDLQQALNRQNANLDVDGVIGHNTIMASLSADLGRLVSDFGSIAEDYLRSRPGFPKFGKGWLNRLNDVRVIAAAMASAASPQAPVSGGGKMPTSVDNIVAVLQQALNVLQAVQKAQTTSTASTTTTPASTTQPQTPTTVDIQKVLDLVKELVTSAPALGQVNGALGQGIGDLLDGKKTAIGTIGALATSILSVPAIGNAVTSVLPAALAATPFGSIAMPIFLALAGWGVLGKMEKWTQGQQK